MEAHIARVTELSITGGRRVSASVQFSVDAACDLEWLEEDVHAAPRPDFVHDEKGKCFSHLVKKNTMCALKRLRSFRLDYPRAIFNARYTCTLSRHN